MSLWVCLDCTAAYSAGAPLCPQCGSERRAEEHEAERLGVRHGMPVDIEEEDMPKITRHEGASVPPAEAAQVEGGEDVSAGADTSTSSETPSEKPEPTETPSPSPAPTTGSRSRKARTVSRTASSTAGDQTAPTSETDSADGEA